MPQSSYWLTSYLHPIMAKYDQEILSLIPRGGVKRKALKEKMDEACSTPRSSFHAILYRLTKKGYVQVEIDLINPKKHTVVTTTKNGRAYLKLLKNSA
jgi:hypothetical protein